MKNVSCGLAYLVDDDEAMRDALAWLLRSRGVESRAWPSAEAFLADYQAEMRGCLVLDMRMHEMTGMELFEHLQGLGCTLPVIFLTGHGDVPMAVQAVKKGAFDFLEKPFEDNALADRIIAALALDARNSAQAVEQETLKARFALLSPREHEVMQGILSGKLNKVIADALNISMRTVEVHRAHVFEKMGVKSAVELAQVARRLGG